MTVELVPASDKKFFLDSLQAAFKNKFRREDLLKYFDKAGATLLNIVFENTIVGGAVVIINSETQHNKLSLLFVNADFRNLGIGAASWRAVEKLYPDTKVWYTSTAWLDKRNLHFYLNKCDFVAFSIYGEPDVHLALEKIMR